MSKKAIVKHLPKILTIVDLTPDFNCYISLCDLAHVEANSRNHVLTKVATLKDKGNKNVLLSTAKVEGNKKSII